MSMFEKLAPVGGPLPPPLPAPAPPSATPKTDGFAIAALVLGCVSWCVLFAGPLAIIFGVVAMYNIRRSGRPGRAHAIAGVASGAFGTLVFVAIIALGLSGHLDS